jgi:hypothetical protein
VEYIVYKGVQNVGYRDKPIDELAKAYPMAKIIERVEILNFKTFLGKTEFVTIFFEKYPKNNFQK